jgi:hypothetical protein
MIDELIAKNWPWFVALIFAAGGFVAMVKSLIAKLDRHEAKLDRHFSSLQDRDLEHDREISDLKARMSALEVMAQGMSRIEGQIADIWKHIVRSQTKD